MPPFLCLSMASYNSIVLFYSQTSLYSILGNQQRRKATCCSAGTQSMHSISLSARLPSFIYDIKCISLHRTVLTWVKLPPCTGRCLLQHELQNQGQFLWDDPLPACLTLAFLSSCHERQTSWTDWSDKSYKTGASRVLKKNADHFRINSIFAGEHSSSLAKGIHRKATVPG